MLESKAQKSWNTELYLIIIIYLPQTRDPYHKHNRRKQEQKNG